MKMEDERDIHGIIEKEFGAKVIEVKKITEGYSHFMYEVRMDKEPFEIIIRFSNNTESGTNLGKEKYIIDILKENGIPTPKVYAFYNPEKKENGYLILEKFTGIRLDTIWEILPEEEKTKLTREMGKQLKRIHEIKLPRFGFIEEFGNIDSEDNKTFKFRDIGKKEEYSAFLRQTLIDFQKDFARLLSYNAVDPNFVADYMRYVSKNLGKIEFTGEPTLIHGDYVTGHIFVEKKDGEYHIQGVIDFEFSASSSPEYDFIKLHRQGFFENKKLKQALKDGYGEINEEAVKMLRLMRDVSFAQVILDAGDKELAEKTLKEVHIKIKKIL